LEILGKVCNFLGISLEKFGNPWKSLEKLEKAWRRGDRILNPLMGRRRLASEALEARRGGGKSSRKPLKTGHRARK
jgi:hypothetical protein